MKTNQTHSIQKGNVSEIFGNVTYIIHEAIVNHNNKANMLTEKLKQWMGNKAYEFFDDNGDENKLENEKSELENKIQSAADMVEEKALVVNDKLDNFLNLFVQFVFSLFGIKEKEEGLLCFDFPTTLKNPESAKNKVFGIRKYLKEWQEVLQGVICLCYSVSNKVKELFILMGFCMQKRIIFLFSYHPYGI